MEQITKKHTNSSKKTIKNVTAKIRIVVWQVFVGLFHLQGSLYLISKIIQQNLTPTDWGLIQKPPQQICHVELSKYTSNLQDKIWPSNYFIESYRPHPSLK